MFVCTQTCHASGPQFKKSRNEMHTELNLLFTVMIDHHLQHVFYQCHPCTHVGDEGFTKLTLACASCTSESLT